MADKVLIGKVLHVSKTTAQWESENRIISKGLLCVEFTSDDRTLVKIGDGSKRYSQLPYIQDGSFKISDYSTTIEIENLINTKFEELGSVVRVKGIKATAAELPTEGNELGDLWFVGTAGETSDSFGEYIWTSENKFEFLGRVQTDVDLSEYAKVTYVDGQITTLDGRVSTLEETVGNIKEYELPTASPSKLGGIKVGSNLKIDESGVLSTDISVATTSTDGLMSSNDKSNLDNLHQYDFSNSIYTTDTLTINCDL